MPMKRFLEEIKGAKKLEWFLLAAAISILLLACLGKNDSSSALRSESEKRLISALNRIEGIGRADALISSEDGYTRVLVIAEGVDDMNVYLNIQHAVRTIVGIELSNIEIVPHGK